MPSWQNFGGERKGGRGFTGRSGMLFVREKENGGLGFKDFTLFNQAMLGKQAWRLIENPQSLVAKVLGACYFPNSSFLEAELGNYPSLTWRSILWGREIVEAGCIKRIGNGMDTRIYCDKWLPRPTTFLPWSRQLISQNVRGL